MIHNETRHHYLALLNARMRIADWQASQINHD